jgi:hypothetical protein
MSETLTVSKKVDVDIVVYDVTDNIGNKFEFEADLDSDNDIRIEVDAEKYILGNYGKQRIIELFGITKEDLE